MTKETFYFSHDYNSRSDIKIKKLLAKHGYSGYGIYWAIIEDLYQNANAMPLDYDCIAFDMHVKSDIIKSIVNDFDLFILNTESFGSMSVQRRMDKRDAKSQKARESALYRWNKIDNDANAIRPHTDSNAIKESIVEETKVKESKENNTAQDEPADFCAKTFLKSLGVENTLIVDYLKVRKTKRLANTQTAFKNIANQISQTKFNANDCIRIAVEKSWGGLTAEWFNDIKFVPKNDGSFDYRQFCDDGYGREISENGQLVKVYKALRKDKDCNLPHRKFLIERLLELNIIIKNPFFNLEQTETFEKFILSIKLEAGL